MPYIRKYGKPRIPRKPRARRVYRKRRTVLSRPQRIAVKKLIHKSVENKFTNVVNSNGAMQQVYVAGVSGVSSVDVCDLMPSIVQGTQINTRIGNQIRIRKVWGNFIFTMSDSVSAGYLNYGAPFFLRFFIGKLKTNQYTAPTTSDFNNLIRYGASLYNASSSLICLGQPTNKDYFTIYYDKVYKIGPSFYSNNLNTGTGINNNDFKSVIRKRINMTKMYSKMLKFNDNAGYPTNDGLYCWAYACNEIGGGSTAGSGPLLYANPVIKYGYNIDISFEDA